MANYITQSDIENQFGTYNVKKWSNLDNSDTSVDTDRVNASIAYAEEYIDNTFRGGPYSLPFSGNNGVPELVVDWASKLAGCWLYFSRGRNDLVDEVDQMQRIRDETISEMRWYAQSSRAPALDAELSGTRPTGPVCV